MIDITKKRNYRFDALSLALCFFLLASNAGITTIAAVSKINKVLIFFIF